MPRDDDSEFDILLLPAHLGNVNKSGVRNTCAQHESFHIASQFTVHDLVCMAM